MASLKDFQSRVADAALLALKGERAAAIEKYTRILADIESGTPYFGEAEVRSKLAELLREAADPREASQLTKAVALFQRERNTARLIDVCLRLAFLHRHAERVALYWVDRAVAAAETGTSEHPAHGDGDAGTLCDALACRGELLTAFGRATEAVDALERAVRLPGGDAHADALATARILAGQTTAGLNALTQSLAEAERGGAPERVIRLRIRLADAKRQIGDQAGALRLLKGATTLAHEIADCKEFPMIMDRLGSALLESGDPSGAARALELGIERMHREQLLETGQLASLYHNLGNALGALGNNTGAERALLEAVRFARGVEDLKTEALALFHLANLAASNDKPNGARERYEEACGLALRLRDQVLEAACLDSLGQLLLRVGEPAKAVDLHRRAAQLHAEVAHHKGQYTDLLNLVQACLLLGETAAARRALDEAGHIAKTKLQDPSWEQAFREGQVSAREGCWARARTSFDAAIARLETERSKLQTPHEQRRWAIRRVEAFEIATAAAFEARDALAAWSYLEGNRARFLEAVSDRRRRLPAALPAETARLYAAAADRLADLRWRQRERPEVTDAALQAELNAAVRAWQELDTEVELLRVQDMPPLQAVARPEQIAECLSNGEAAAALHVTERWIGATCIGRSRDGGLWWDCDIDPRFGLAQLSRAVIGRAKPGDAGTGTSWADLPNLSSAEAEHLVASTCAMLGDFVWPLLERLLGDRADALVLMPGRGLNVLPLHAAPIASGEPAMDRWSVRYAPSLTLLARAGRPGTLPQRRILAQVVNPTGDLPFAMREAAAIRATWRGEAMHPLCTEHARPDRVLPLFEQVDALHFAGHGAFDADDPLRSHLSCAPGGSAGALTLRALLERVPKARARVVLLSACETGRVDAGDPLNDQLGLPGGLLIAGATAVVATHWHVNDLAAGLVLTRCIELWEGSAVDLERALAEAQAWLRDRANVRVAREWIEEQLDAEGVADPRLEAAHGELVARDQNELLFKHAFYWAPFHVTGRQLRTH